MARRGRIRRSRWTAVSEHCPVAVVLSAVLTVALFVGYVVGDLYDVLPGVLTLHPMRVPTVPSAREVITGDGLVTAAGQGTSIDATAAQHLIDAFAASEGVGDDFSIVIADADGTVIASRDADIVREPASTMKTLTSLAASKVLDLSTTLDTETYLMQSKGDIPTLVLKGNGDMLLGTGNNDPDHINGRAGLGTLADQTVDALRQRGITQIRLLYDDSLFGEQRYPANIEQNNGGHLYYAPISSMAVDGGRDWEGDPPDDPDVYTGYPELSTQPAVDAAAAFAAMLSDRGILLKDSPSAGLAPEDMSPLTSVSSAQLSEIMAFMLRHSDNTLAEEFGRLIALATGYENSPSGATQAVTDSLRNMGIATDALTMADCSGLSPGSRLDARILIDVQAAALSGGSGSAVVEGMSVPGLSGTASDRLDDETMAGLLRVKTGTLDAVTAMTGNVSRMNGGVLCFAIVVNQPENAWEAARAVDVFISDLPEL